MFMFFNPKYHNFRIFLLVLLVDLTFLRCFLPHLLHAGSGLMFRPHQYVTIHDDFYVFVVTWGITINDDKRVVPHVYVISPQGVPISTSPDSYGFNMFCFDVLRCFKMRQPWISPCFLAKQQFLSFAPGDYGRCGRWATQSPCATRFSGLKSQAPRFYTGKI